MPPKSPRTELPADLPGAALSALGSFFRSAFGVDMDEIMAPTNEEPPAAVAKLTIQKRRPPAIAKTSPAAAAPLLKAKRRSASPRPVSKAKPSTPSSSAPSSGRPMSAPPVRPPSRQTAPAGLSMPTGSATPASSTATPASSSTPSGTQRGSTGRGGSSRLAGLSALTDSAPLASAKAYSTRINRLLGTERSVASLLFDHTSAELWVTIDATHDTSTISALQLPRSVEACALRRTTAGKPVMASSSLKVAQGDEILLRGAPNALVTVAGLKGAKATLLGGHAREGIAQKVRRERQVLTAAAEDLQRRLLPPGWMRIEETRLHQKRNEASVLLQARRRGNLARRSTRGAMRARRAQRVSAKLRARRLRTALLAYYHSLRWASQAQVGLKLDDGGRVAEEVREWRTREQLMTSMRYAKQASNARAHAETLCQCLMAAPEFRKRSAPKVLSLLLSPPIQLTALIEPSMHGVSVGALDLPSTVQVVKLSTGGKATALRAASAPGAAPLSSMSKIAMQAGDAVALLGLPHHVVALTEAKGGKLKLLAPHARKPAAQVKILKQQRLSLLASAERLACWLQRIVRARFDRRREAKRQHAALLVQIAWHCLVARTGKAHTRVHASATRPTRTGASSSITTTTSQQGDSSTRPTDGLPTHGSPSPILSLRLGCTRDRARLMAPSPHLGSAPVPPAYLDTPLDTPLATPLPMVFPTGGGDIFGASGSTKGGSTKGGTKDGSTKGRNSSTADQACRSNAPSSTLRRAGKPPLAATPLPAKVVPLQPTKGRKGSPSPTSLRRVPKGSPQKGVVRGREALGKEALGGEEASGEKGVSEDVAAIFSEAFAKQ